MKDIDELKRKWREIEIPAPDASAGKGNFRREIPRSLKERICRMLQRMLLLAAIGLLTAPSFSKNFDAPLWFTICFIGYFTLAAMFNLYQLRMLKHADFSTATTVEAIEFVRRFSITRARCKTILICLAIPLVVIIICMIDHESEPVSLLGVLVGCVIGSIIGLIINRKFKKNIALMLKYLEGVEE